MDVGESVGSFIKVLILTTVFRFWRRHQRLFLLMYPWSWISPPVTSGCGGGQCRRHPPERGTGAVWGGEGSSGKIVKITRIMAGEGEKGALLYRCRLSDNFPIETPRQWGPTGPGFNFSSACWEHYDGHRIGERDNYRCWWHLSLSRAGIFSATRHQSPACDTQLKFESLSWVHT